MTKKNGRRTVSAECPECGLQVVIYEDAIERKIKCPQCKAVVQFLRGTTEEEMLKQAARSVGDGVVKAGSLLGKGLGRLREKRRSTKALKALTADVRRHLSTELPSTDRLADFRKRCDEAGGRWRVSRRRFRDCFGDAFPARCTKSGKGEHAARRRPRRCGGTVMSSRLPKR